MVSQDHRFYFNPRRFRETGIENGAINVVHKNVPRTIKNLNWALTQGMQMASCCWEGGGWWGWQGSGVTTSPAIPGGDDRQEPDWVDMPTTPIWMWDYLWIWFYCDEIFIGIFHAWGGGVWVPWFGSCHLVYSVSSLWKSLTKCLGIFLLWT